MAHGYSLACWESDNDRNDVITKVRIFGAAPSVVLPLDPTASSCHPPVASPFRFALRQSIRYGCVNTALTPSGNATAPPLAAIKALENGTEPSTGHRYNTQYSGAHDAPRFDPAIPAPTLNTDLADEGARLADAMRCDACHATGEHAHWPWARCSRCGGIGMIQP